MKHRGKNRKMLQYAFGYGASLELMKRNHKNIGNRMISVVFKQSQYHRQALKDALFGLRYSNACVEHTDW